MTLTGPTGTDMILQRLSLSTTMFRTVEVVDELPSERPNLRRVRLRLSLN